MNENVTAMNKKLIEIQFRAVKILHYKYGERLNSGTTSKYDIIIYNFLNTARRILARLKNRV